MTATEILQVLQAASAVLAQVNQTLDHLKALGVDLSGVKLQTSSAIDLMALFTAAKKPT